MLWWYLWKGEFLPRVQIYVQGEPAVEVGDFTRISDHFGGIYARIPQMHEGKNQRMSNM
jgi:hypothetical protein